MQAHTQHKTSNVYLWGAFSATAIGIGLYFIFYVHRGITLDTWLAIVGLLARTGFYVSVGVLLEALLLRSAGGYFTMTRWRRLVLHSNWVLLLMICLSIIVDLLVFSFAGYHVTTAIKILMSDGPTGVAKVIDAAGLPLTMVFLGLLLLGVMLAAAGWLSRYTWSKSAQTGISISRKTAALSALLSVGIIAIVETVGYHARDPYLWEREVRTVPLAFAIVRPNADLASFKVSVLPHDIKNKRAMIEKIPTIENKPDIYIVVMESLRKEILSPDIMPQLYTFSQSGLTFDHPVTTGNVTHYSWYGLFCGEHPLYFDVVKKNPSEQGSVPIALLKHLGYKINFFATPDTAYQNLESIVFGPGSTLLDRKFHPPHKNPADRDHAVIDEVVRHLDQGPRGGQVNIIALDSTHFDYAWSTAFSPPFRPFAPDASIVRPYEKDPKARQELFNRYKNAAAYMDTLVGRLIESLKRTSRLDDSIVVITADHGEAFWEHGVGSHGSDLSSEQIEVVFTMHLPNQPSVRYDGVFSLLDVMPTIVAQLGVQAPELFAGIALQQRQKQGNKLDHRSALTYQGWNARAFRFALSDTEHRVQLELDSPDPLQSKHLAIKDLTDLDSHTLVQSDKSSTTAYLRLSKELPNILGEIPFLPKLSHNSWGSNKNLPTLSRLCYNLDFTCPNVLNLRPELRLLKPR